MPCSLFLALLKAIYTYLKSYIYSVNHIPNSPVLNPMNNFNSVVVGNTD